MDFTGRIAELAPRRRRRVQRIALVVFPVTTVMTVLVIVLSAASMQLYWRYSPAQVALSIGLAVTAVVVCGIAGVNARRTLGASRSTAPTSAASPRPHLSPDLPDAAGAADATSAANAARSRGSQHQTTHLSRVCSTESTFEGHLSAAQEGNSAINVRSETMAQNLPERCQENLPLRLLGQRRYARVGVRVRRSITSLALASVLVVTSAGAASAARFSTSGAQFGYTLSFSHDGGTTEGSGELRDTSADGRCAWLQVHWDKALDFDPVSTHAVCGSGDSVPVSLYQNSRVGSFRSVTLKLCTIQNGKLSACRSQKILR